MAGCSLTPVSLRFLRAQQKSAPDPGFVIACNFVRASVNTYMGAVLICHLTGEETKGLTCTGFYISSVIEHTVFWFGFVSDLLVKDCFHTFS